MLVNNAVLRPMRRYEDPTEAFRTSMEVNAVGVFHITRTFAEAMKERRRGSIINISSIQGMVGPDRTLYEGTKVSDLPDCFLHKAGLINPTRYFASKLGPYGIRVNCISPGECSTIRTRSSWKDITKGPSWAVWLTERTSRASWSSSPRTLLRTSPGRTSPWTGDTPPSDLYRRQPCRRHALT